jgi:hypothetical protein
MPAVENAAIPQYNACPYEVMADPSIPYSAEYNPAEKNSHNMINSKIIFVKGV